MAKAGPAKKSAKSKRKGGPKKRKSAPVAARGSSLPALSLSGFWRFLGKAALFCTICLVAFVAITYVMIIGLSGSLSDPRDLGVAPGAAPIQIVARDGTQLANYGPNQGDWVAYEDIPRDIVNAIVAIEDRRFFSHGGLDFRGIGRAALTNLRAGGIAQGGSSLTQQLAKNVYLDPSRTLTRKVREAMFAIALEQKLTKEEIIEAYLNRMYFGSGAYGIEAASYRYFGHGARQLSLGKSALLAGVVKAPSRLSPKADMKAALARRDVVLTAMAQEGYILPSEAQIVSATPVAMIETASDPDIRYFTDWISAQVRSAYPESYQRLKVITTLDPKAQRAAQAAVKAHLPPGHKPTAGLQAGLVALDHDGAVQAMVGGRAYRASSYNRAVQALRQPGSAFKTFVYLAALENGMTLASRLRDTPVQLGDYAPKNYGGGFSGQLITLEDAYVRSVNSVAVKLAERVDRPKVAGVARRLGISTPIVVEPSIALGTSEVYVIDLAAAYGAIANGGYAVRPRGILEVRGPRGDVITPTDAADPNGGERARARVLDDNIARAMSGLMQSAAQRGTGRNARVAAGRTIAGKTGTTQNGQDGWFAGYSDRLVAAVWVGRDDNAPVQGLTGGGMPARIWGDFIARAQAGEPDKRLSQPVQQAGAGGEGLSQQMPQTNEAKQTRKRGIFGFLTGRRAGVDGE